MSTHAQTVAHLQHLGFTLRNPAALEGIDDDPWDVLTAWDEGGYAFDHVLSYDAEMVEDDDAYTAWVAEGAEATGRTAELTHLAGHTELDGNSWLEYTLAGTVRRTDFVQEGDWLVPEVADAIIEDFRRVPGRTMLYLDNGQGGVFVWVPAEQVTAFAALFPEAEPA